MPVLVAGSRCCVLQPNLRLGGGSRQIPLPICPHGLENSGRVFHKQPFRSRPDAGRVPVDWNDDGAPAV